MTDADYDARVDEISNSPEARQLLQAVLATANHYFDFLEQRGVHVSNITIANYHAPRGARTVTRYIDSETLQQGGNLTSRH
jgi:hypothetical protein